MKYLILSILLTQAIYCAGQIQRLQIGEEVSIQIGLTEASVLRYWAAKGVQYDVLQTRCDSLIRDLEMQVEIQERIIQASRTAARSYADLYAASVQASTLDQRYIGALEEENRKQKAELLKFSKTTTRDLFIWGGAGILVLASLNILSK